LDNFIKKFVYFRDNISLMDNLFEACFTTLAATGKPLSRCGKCLRYMKLIALQPQRLYCSTCEEIYALPQNGTIKLYKELKCPLDNFDLVLFSLGNTEKAQGKSYPLCPYCYNNPPSFKVKKPEEEEEAEGEEGEEGTDEGDDEDEEGEEEEDDGVGMTRAAEDTNIIHMGCDKCMHPTCKHSAVANGVCPCPGTVVPKPVVGRRAIRGGGRGGRGSRGGGGGGRGRGDDRGRGGAGGRGGRGRGRGGPDVNVVDDEDEEEEEDKLIECPGTMILDVNSKPNWKLSCNQCNTLIRFQAEIHNIIPMSLTSSENGGYCKKCSVRLLKFEFNKLKTPLPNGETVYTGCISCDPFLMKFTEILAGRTMNITVLGQIRHRKQMMLAQRGKRGGRGRGRGGRGGRGGGRMSKKDILMSFSDF
jgi:uncharacterized membrane protein YgcG